MARQPIEDAPEDPPEALDEAPSPPPRPRSRSRPKHAAGKRLQAWDEPPQAEGSAAPPAADDEEPEEPPRRGWFGRPKERVYFRFRDSVWFEPLVALLLIVLLLGGLFAYTQNWPPVYVVESESMQHGYDDQLGLINTGDLVLAQKVPNASIVTYVVGLRENFVTYGEYGDVLLYHPNDNLSAAPIIHRALLFLVYDPYNDSYSAPSLNGLTCGPASQPGVVYTATGHGTVNGCGTSGLRGTLTLHGIGWQSTNVPIDLSSGVLGGHSGFVTMGDNNFAPGSVGQGVIDQEGGISELVNPAWVVGVARGMIPWFGAIKLYLDGDSGEVPSQSWQYLGLTVVGLFLAALALHAFLRSRGIEDERRKKEEETEEREEEQEARAKPPPGRPPSAWSRLTAWGSRESDREDDEGAAAPKTHRPRRRSPPSGDSEEEDEAPARGRPAPRVGRRPSDDVDEDL